MTGKGGKRLRALTLFILWPFVKKGIRNAGSHCFIGPEMKINPDLF
jgi:hypothetical protein